MREKTEFERIFRLYYEPLYRFALQWVADEEECHDIVSSAYEDVWRSFDRVEAATVRAYLYTSVRNRCIDHLRHRAGHERYVAYAEAMTERYVENAHQLDAADRQRLVDRMLRELKPPTRDILEACYIEGKKYSEVAQQMGISISTVKKHMVKALKTLRELGRKIERLKN